MARGSVSMTKERQKRELRGKILCNLILTLLLAACILSMCARYQEKLESYFAEEDCSETTWILILDSEE